MVFLRTRGRIAKTNYYDYNIINPILLSKKHHLTKLIVSDCHLACKHLGLQTTLNMVRLKGFWITKARQTVKNIIESCLICKKYNSFTFNYPKFTNYTQAQMDFFRPFKHTGVDFTSHFWIKDGSVEKKMYILIYTCLNIRAVHLDLLPDMSTQSFLSSFMRFTKIYGIVDFMYSDNARTFALGGNAIENSLISDEFQEHMRINNIKHVRLPLYAPWMGSAWERMLRILKNCIYKTVGRSKLKYFDMISLLSSIQNSINNRPLTYVESSLDLVPLTPNSFLKLHGSASLTVKTDEDPDDPLWEGEPASHKQLNDHLLFLQQKFEHFRTIWYETYLLSLREYSYDLYQNDWVNRIKVGDVVLIKSATKTRPYWQLGRVIKLIYGADNCVRTVMLKKGDGNIAHYPINILYPTEVSVTHNGDKTNKPIELNNTSDKDEGVRKVPQRQAAITARKKTKDIFSLFD